MNGLMGKNNIRKFNRKDVPRVFSRHHPDILFTYLHRHQQDCEADCKENEGLAHDVALYCGVRCLSEQYMNVSYIS